MYIFQLCDMSPARIEIRSCIVFCGVAWCGVAWRGVAWRAQFGAKAQAPIGDVCEGLE